MPAVLNSMYPPTYAFASNEDQSKQTDTTVDVRYLTRTPSPTPSETVALDPNRKKRRGFLLALIDPATFKDPKELVRLLITGGIIALVVLFIVYQQNIVNWLRPFADWMRRTPGGWVIPIVIMIVLSFPPLFGHEIIAILCGDVWGVWIGFAIVAAGTILGELLNYYVFRTFCMMRGRKWEQKRLQYALLAEVVRRGGFFVAVIIRYSAIPGHLSTTVFATCGISVFTFLGAAFLSLPQQLSTVYLGAAQSNGTVSHTTKTIKTVVIVVTVLTTMFAMHFIRIQTDKVTPEVVYSRRKARQAKLCSAPGMDPEFDAAATPYARAAEAAMLDGVTIHVPTPQAASVHGYAVEHIPGPSAWHPEGYAVPQAPEAGYGQYVRSQSKSPLPQGSPHGSGSAK